MGTLSSIATGLVHGYVNGQKINAFMDQEKQRKELDDQDIDKGKDDAAKRKRYEAANLKRINRDREVDYSLIADFGSAKLPGPDAPQAEMPSADAPAASTTNPAPQFAQQATPTQPVQQAAVVHNTAASTVLAPRIKPIGGLAQPDPTTTQIK